jgi:hypothetical protein
MFQSETPFVCHIFLSGGGLKGTKAPLNSRDFQLQGSVLTRVQPHNQPSLPSPVAFSQQFAGTWQMFLF